MKIINDYVRLVLFCFGLLVGIQVPAFIDQYTKRVDAKLIEASQLLVGFQHTADRYFEGDLSKLVEHYRHSTDAVFKQDADNIQLIFDRVTTLQHELTILEKNSVAAAIHIIISPALDILHETIDQYTYVIILNPLALLWGIIVALIISSVCESLLVILVKGLRKLRFVL